jgi:hypothetical protein
MARPAEHQQIRIPLVTEALVGQVMNLKAPRLTAILAAVANALELVAAPHQPRVGTQIEAVIFAKPVWH